MNKKILTSLLALSMLTGCTTISNPEFTSTLVDGDQTIISVNGVDVNKNDIYHYMLSSLGPTSVIETALLAISDFEINDESLVNERSIESISGYSEYVENGSIEEYAISQGYDSQEEYMEEKIIPQVKKDLLKEKFVTIHLDSILSEYLPRFIKLISFDDEDAALEVLETISTEEDFNDLMDDNYGNDYGLVSTLGGIDTNIVSNLADFTEDGVYPELISSEYGGYYIVYVYNSDIETTDKDLLIREIASGISTISTDYEVFYFDLYKLSIYESYIKKIVE